ncbi:MAG: hypothetical protein JJ969_08075 [Rhizobiaceae bacterium]|nr:hypothetical protein [Rhizobiaceae bacterium]
MAASETRFFHRLRMALPGPVFTVSGTFAWAVAMAASAAVSLLVGGRLEPEHSQTVIVIFALGGVLSFPVALYATRLMVPGARAERRYAAALFNLGICTILATAFVFAMHYRIYFAQWHGDFPSVQWVFQLLFTGAGAVYQFAVLGTRHFFPLGIVLLFGASLLVARQAR